MTDSIRQGIINKAIFHLFDCMSKSTDDFFKPLGPNAMTGPECGEIQVTAAANYLRYCIHNNIKEDGRDEAIELIMEGMKFKPENIDDQSPKLFSDQEKVDFGMNIVQIPSSDSIIIEDNKMGA